jgi:phenylalanyl-tRNA synthetase beta chain
MLMKEIAGGTISSEIVDVYPIPVENFKVDISYQRINTLIGQQIEKETVKNILTSLAIEIVSENEEGLQLSVPPFKVDVTREADVVEEILRIYGYNNIDLGDSLHSSLSYSRKPDPEKLQQKLADYLSNNGFNEILTNSLTSSAYYEKSEVFSFDECVKILNPLSSELGVMRQTLLFSGLESISYNLNRRMADLKFYEFGNVYNYVPAQSASNDVTRKYTERKKLSIYVTGSQQGESWYQPSGKTDYHFLKSLVFATLRKTGINMSKLVSSPVDIRLLAEGEAFSINNKQLLSIGRLNTSVLKQFDIKQEVFYAELDWSILVRDVKPDSVKFSEISRYPEVRRDLALVLDKSVKFSDIEALANRNGKGILRSVNLFDVYEGEKIESGKKSYAVSFTMQDDQKTLTDKDIEKLMKHLADIFEKELGAVIRK